MITGLGLSTGDLSRIPDPAGLEELQKRFTAGEPLRMWYSDQPDEPSGCVSASSAPERTIFSIRVWINRSEMRS